MVTKPDTAYFKRFQSDASELRPEAISKDADNISESQNVEIPGLQLRHRHIVPN